MTTLLQLVASGLAAGSLYALLALGLVLIYQVSGVLNFAQGALAALGAYLVWSLTTMVGLPFWPAAAITFASTFACGMLLQAALLRPLRRAPAAASLIVTLGLLSIVETVIGQVWGLGINLFVLPIPAQPIRVGDVAFDRTDLATIGVAVALMLTFFAFLRLTHAGMVLRAVAQTRRGAALVGIRVDRVVIVAWGLSAALAAVAGLFIGAKVLVLSPSMADIYLLSAFTGAIIGGLDSLPGAAAGALAVGVIQDLVGYYISNEWHDAVVFVLLLAVLLVRPSGLFGRAVQQRV